MIGVSRGDVSSEAGQQTQTRSRRDVESTRAIRERIGQRGDERQAVVVRRHECCGAGESDLLWCFNLEWRHEDPEPTSHYRLLVQLIGNADARLNVTLVGFPNLAVVFVSKGVAAKHAKLVRGHREIRDSR